MSRLMKMGFAQKATPLFINSELVNQIMHLYYSLHIFKIRSHHGMHVSIYSSQNQSLEADVQPIT